MKNSTYITNCAELVDLDSIIDSIPESKGLLTPKSYDLWMERFDKDILSIEKCNGAECHKSVKGWQASNMNIDAISVRCIDARDMVKDTFSGILNIKEVLWAEFSQSEPGKMLPHHCDAIMDDWIEAGAKKYSIFASKAEPGHVFILGEDHYCQPTQGDIIEWHDMCEWHTGMNFGIKSKWLLNVVVTTN